jgi:hypothetical protein
VWLGSSNRSVSEDGVKENSPLMSLFGSSDRKRLQKEMELKRTKKGNREALWKALTEEHNRRTYAYGSSTSIGNDDGDEDEDDDIEREAVARQAQIRNDYARSAYASVVSIEEEVDLLLSEAKFFLDFFAAHSSESWGASTASAVSMRARANAVQRALGVGSDGHAAPMSALDWLRYGTNRNKLEKLLERARKNAVKIEESLESMGDAETKYADATLVQYFVLEHFDVYKQYVLKSKFFSFPMCSVPVISVSAWALSWLFLTAMMCFFFYYILAWGLQNGDSAFEAWWLNFIVGFIMEFFVIQIARIYVINVLAMYSIKPQLDYIYRTLQKVAIDNVQNIFHETNISYMKMRNIRVCQHFSPACRASHSKVALDLASAKILRSFDDCEMHQCRKNRSTRMRSFGMFVVGLPVIFAIMTGEMGGEGAFQAFAPTIVSLFVLANFYILTYSWYILASLYAFLVSYLLFRMFLLKPSRNMVESHKHDTVTQSYSTKWKESRRKAANASGYSPSRRDSTYSLYLESLKYYLAQGALAVYEVLFNPARVFARAYRKATRTDETFISDEKRFMMIWTNMNLPLPLQGRTRPKKKRKKKKKKEKRNASSLVSISEELRDGKTEAGDDVESVFLTLPTEITSMRRSDWVSEWVHSPKQSYLIELLNSRLLNAGLHHKHNRAVIPATAGVAAAVENEVSIDTGRISHKEDMPTARQVHTPYEFVRPRSNWN